MSDFFNLRKGYLAPVDYVFVCCLALVSLSIGVVLYRLLLRGWIQNLRYPSTLRWLCGGGTAFVLAASLYWFMRYILTPVAESKVDSLFGDTARDTIWGSVAYLIYNLIVLFTAKRPSAN